MKRRTQAAWIVAMGALLTLLATTALAASSLFFDDFDRPDQPLTSGDWTSLGGGAPSINAGRACADVQVASIYAQKLRSKHVRVSFSFNAADAEGLEAYIALPTSHRFYIVGCDGGSAVCTPTIRSTGADGNDDGGPATRGPSVSLSANTTYRLAAELDDGLILLRISDTTDKVLAELGLSVHETFDRCGLVVGRNPDGLLTCADDFRIEDLGL